uniref:Uncharacterized protein n=1 Tax=Angiostrongylus cantonensis TaxID=6313 RepID=A0A0K0DIH1_ANGCA
MARTVGGVLIENIKYSLQETSDFQGIDVCNNDEGSLDSLTDFDEPPPSLDQVVCKSTIMQKEESPPEGLVRPKDDIQIRPRAGVSAVLARRLAASVTGSFSKYDGERGATHHYQGGPTNEPLKAASPPMLEALDESIVTARRVDYCEVSLPAAANSTSSSNSVNSRVEYVTIDLVSTTAAREVA